MIIMWGMGLSLTPVDFKRIFQYPKAVVVGLVNQMILLPVIGFTLVNIFPVNPEIAVGVMILAACPGGATSNLITHLAKGDTALSVTLTAFSSFISVLTIPFVVNFALENLIHEGTVVKLNEMESIRNIFMVVIIPVILGMLVRRLAPGFSDKMGKPVRIASMVILGLIIVGIVIKEKENMLGYFAQAGWIAFTLNVITMLVGFYSARLFKLTNRQATSISIESGIQNGTLALGVAIGLLGNISYSIAPAIYSLLMFFSGGFMVYFGTKSLNVEFPVDQESLKNR